MRTQTLNGLIDEVTIYDRALSTAEIQAIFNAGSAGKCKDDEMEFFSLKDSFLRQGQRDRNEGANPLLDLGEDRRLVVGFDLSGVDTSAVSRATLVLTINDETPARNWSPSGRFVDVHRLLGAWAEGNGNENTRSTGLGVTWNCAIDTAIEN